MLEELGKNIHSRLADAAYTPASNALGQHCDNPYKTQKLNEPNGFNALGGLERIGASISKFAINTILGAGMLYATGVGGMNYDNNINNTGMANVPQRPGISLVSIAYAECEDPELLEMMTDLTRIHSMKSEEQSGLIRKIYPYFDKACGGTQEQKSNLEEAVKETFRAKTAPSGTMTRYQTADYLYGNSKNQDENTGIMARRIACYILPGIAEEYNPKPAQAQDSGKPEAATTPEYQPEQTYMDFGWGSGRITVQRSSDGRSRSSSVSVSGTGGSYNTTKFESPGTNSSRTSVYTRQGGQPVIAQDSHYQSGNYQRDQTTVRTPGGSIGSQRVKTPGNETTYYNVENRDGDASVTGYRTPTEQGSAVSVYGPAGNYTIATSRPLSPEEKARNNSRSNTSSADSMLTQRFKDVETLHGQGSNLTAVQKLLKILNDYPDNAQAQSMLDNIRAEMKK